MARTVSDQQTWRTRELVQAHLATPLASAIARSMSDLAAPAEAVVAALLAIRARTLAGIPLDVPPIVLGAAAPGREQGACARWEGRKVAEASAIRSPDSKDLQLPVARSFPPSAAALPEWCIKLKGCIASDL